MPVTQLPRVTEYERKSQVALEKALYQTPAYRPWQALDPGEQAPLDARYAALPELTKKMMREHFPHGLIAGERDLQRALAEDEVEYTFTSGTSSEKVINLFNQRWWWASEASSWRLNAHTAALGDAPKAAKLASALNIGIHCEEDLPMEHRILGRTLYLNEKLNIICWQPRHLARMASELQAFQPDVLEANPSLLVRLAWWAMDNGHTLYRPKVIIFTYEFPSRLHTQAIRQAFGAPMASSYGSTETGYVLMECERGLFHQNTAFCRADFEPLAPQHGGPDLGRILVTTFENPWASVLRFDMGDIIRLHPGPCGCARTQGITAAAVEGRIANATFTTRGMLVTTKALDDALCGVIGLRDYQMVQRSHSRYQLQVMFTGEEQGAVEVIRKALARLYGGDGVFEIARTEAILPGPSGKYIRTTAQFPFDVKGLFV